MNAPLYKRAIELYSDLRELPESEWAKAADTVCGEDVPLRAEVLRLLDAERQVSRGEFLARPAMQEAAQLLASGSAGLPEPGALVGSYRLGARIGAGGMGVVYEAEDERLRRRIALKILPFSSAPGAWERIRRFEQEARAISALNHPNIVSIFHADFDRNCFYIAMELVEGRTLRELIRSERGRIDGREILDILSQTSSALNAAHEAAIVHRDIKPENIMVRRDGIVKLLDFGLARLRDPENSANGEPPLLTRPGQLAGTIQYLSPEQVLGKPATCQSDLFGLGVVAYELATGVRPFDGPTDGAVFDAILHREPEPPSSLHPSLGAGLDGLILGALEKQPDRRFRSASDLRNACGRLMRDSTRLTIEHSAPRELKPSPVRRRALLTTGAKRLQIAALSCAVLAAAALWLMRPVAQPHVTGIVPVLRGAEQIFHFVNDGARLYYSTGKENPEERFFQAGIHGGDPVPMPQLRGMFPLDISSEGSEMLLGQFLPGTTNGPYPIWIASAVGGAPRRLGNLTANEARWSPRGDRILYSYGRDLRLANSDGSGARSLATLKGTPFSPAWSPDGRLIRFTLFAGNTWTLWEIAPEGTNLRPLLPGWAGRPHREGVWTPDGRCFVFAAPDSTSNLWAIREGGFFPGRRSEPAQLTFGPVNATYPQASSGRQRIFFKGSLNVGQLVRYDPPSDQWVPLLAGLSATYLEYSPDGSRIAYVSYPEGFLWRARADDSDGRQLTASPLRVSSPRWSPDGRYIAFVAASSGKQSRIFVVPADGGAIREITHGEAGPAGEVDPAWSVDGRSIFFGSQSIDSQGVFTLRKAEVFGHSVEELPKSQGLWSPRISPDGRYIAALGNPDFHLWLYEIATQQRTQLTPMAVGWPSWSHDGKFIYFEDNATTSFYRLRLEGRRIEARAPITGLKFAPSTLGWVGITPNGSLMATRDAGGTAIYALDWDTR